MVPSAQLTVAYAGREVDGVLIKGMDLHEVCKRVAEKVIAESASCHVPIMREEEGYQKTQTAPTHLL